MGGNTQKYLAELFGTAVLVLIGCSSIVVEGFGGAFRCGFIGIGMTFGMTVTAMAYAIGPVSGCHLNPVGDGGGVGVRPHEHERRDRLHHLADSSAASSARSSSISS